jgi:predicted Rossmann fold flavoprotein
MHESQNTKCRNSGRKDNLSNDCYPSGMKHTDVVIIGGGAAGIMCAIIAAQRGRSVVILEGSNKIGKKILMSGGGRCNFTNIHTEPENFLSLNSHFCKSALSRYTQWDFIALVEKHNIPYHEKTLGQLFCDISSKEIVTMLSKECEDAGVDILTEVKNIEVASGEGFSIDSNHGQLACESLVIASGGLSIPKMGASDFGYEMARQFGLRMINTRAGLVPFTVTGTMHELCERLSGVSCDVTVSVGGISFSESMLFTHRGFSGPAMLQASSYWTPGDSLEINLLPHADAEELLFSAKAARRKSLLRVVLAEVLPKALLVELQLMMWSELAESPIADLSDASLRNIAARLTAWEVKPAATEGYRTAEVTLGGIDTDELSSKTLESKQQPGLYFIGEVVDMTGHLGGHNFQWAWSSGHAAGQVA